MTTLDPPMRHPAGGLHLRPAPLEVRLHSLIVEQGGSITKPRLTAYLGELLHVDSTDLRDEILLGLTAGRYELAHHNVRGELAVEIHLRERGGDLT